MKIAFITLAVLPKCTSTGVPAITIPVNDIKSVEDIAPTARQVMDGAMATVKRKGTDAPLFATEPADEILAKIADAQQPEQFALARYKATFHGAGVAWFEVVALGVPRLCDVDVEYNHWIRTPDGMAWWTDEELWQSINAGYAEVL